MKSASFEHASQADAEAQVAEARKFQPDGMTPEGWQRILDKFGLTEKGVVAHVQQQIDLMRLVDSHLRPAVQIDSKSVEAYYREKFVPQLRQTEREQMGDQTRNPPAFVKKSRVLQHNRGQNGLSASVARTAALDPKAKWQVTR